jgi:pimeloyl-ACP methyl ester carboxylesterase
MTCSTDYARCLADFPLQSNPAGWRWLDTRAGGRTLILLPGFMGEADTSFLYVLALKDAARVLSVSYPPSIGQVQTLGASFSAFLDDLGIAQATILGGSSSGFLAQAFLRQIPTRISACILTHTGLPTPKRARTAQFYLTLLRYLPFGLVRSLALLSISGYFPRPNASHTFWRDHFRAVIRQQSRASLANRFALMDDFHRHYHFHPADLTGWPGQILIMEMRRDHLTTPAEQAALRALYPTARVHTFTDTAHYDSVEQPDEQIRVIREFLCQQCVAPC